MRKDTSITALATNRQPVPAHEFTTRAGFEALYDCYAPALYGVACKLANDKGVAAVILKAAFLLMWKQSSTMPQANVFTWMHNITRDVAIATIDAVLKERRQPKQHP